jgi:hypothetical protein
MDAEVLAMMNRASTRKLDKLAAATESAHNAYYAACDAYYAACAVHDAYYAACAAARGSR